MDVNGTPQVIGFLPPIHVVEDDWMSDEDIRATIHDIHTRVVRLDEQRTADVNEVADLKVLVVRLENRMWLALAGTVAALGTAVLGLVL